MKDLISIAVLITSLYGGSLLGEQIFQSVRRNALEKAAHGLPPLSKLSLQLARKNSHTGRRKDNEKKKDLIQAK